MDNIKDTLRALYTEQLLAREQPVGRSSAGWQSILETAQRNLDCRLIELHSVPEVFTFGEKRLKIDHLREAFRFLAVESSCEDSVPESVVNSFVHPSCEHESLDRDLQALPSDLSAFACSLRSASGTMDVCEESEPNPSTSSQAFSSLQGQSGVEFDIE